MKDANYYSSFFYLEKKGLFYPVKDTFHIEFGCFLAWSH